MNVPAKYVKDEATLERWCTGDDGTCGGFIARSFACVSLEPPWRDNKHRKSCIPPGRYRCILDYSDHFDRDLYFLTGVPDRGAVMIHVGNWAGDPELINPATKLPYRSDTKGCILLGKHFDNMLKQRAVVASQDTIDALVAHFAGKPFILTVKWKLINGDVQSYRFGAAKPDVPVVRQEPDSTGKA